MGKKKGEKNYVYANGESMMHVYIPDWMHKILGLTGATKELYAYIYSFTRSGLQYEMSQERICGSIGCSPATIRRGIKTLRKGNLIIEHDPIRIKGHYPITPYTANMHELEKYDDLPPGVTMIIAED